MNTINKKTAYIIAAIVVLIAVGAWLWLQAPVSQAPSAGELPQGATGAAVQASDTTSAIDQDFQNINIEDPNFQSIDSDVNSL